ncbi:hypothetical protein MN116_000827 [Schistosoma mekongi]|uniref:C2H2-type domain-containing protein n=1 Tax=Schistosoma mekongi TaxID=38744 RepID=A0AAE1ZKK1_SCHME|nr:hypothetical protein MN116_000827 [Schistosoma mekongi]
MNTIPTYLNEVTTSGLEKNEHFIRAFHCFFELFSKATINNDNKGLYTTKYLHRFENKPSYQSLILTNVSDNATDTTTTTINTTERTNLNTNHENYSSHSNTYQSLFLSELHKVFRNQFIPQDTTYTKCQKFNESLKNEDNSYEYPLDLSMSSNHSCKSLTKSINYTTNYASPLYSSLKQREEDKQLTLYQLNCEYTQRIKPKLSSQIHLSCDYNMKRKKTFKRIMNQKSARNSNSHDSNSMNNSKNPFIDMDMKLSYKKSNTNITKLQHSSSSSLSTTLPTINYAECSPPGKQPVTRCNHCHVLFPSLYELNNHFITEHNVILQAEMEHTKSWKSHTIDDTSLQNMKILLNRSNNMNTSGYPCPNCDYIAKWPTELQKHIMVHSKQRPHRCIICGLSYKWKWDLGRHFDKSHNKTMNPYKKNVFNHLQHHDNRIKNVNKSNIKTKKLSLTKNTNNLKFNDQFIICSMSNSTLFSTTSTYNNSLDQQQIKINEILKQNKITEPIDLTSYT